MNSMSNSRSLKNNQKQKSMNAIEHRAFKHCTFFPSLERPWQSNETNWKLLVYIQNLSGNSSSVEVHYN